MPSDHDEFPWPDEYPEPATYARCLRSRAMEGGGPGVAIDTLVDARMYADEVEDHLSEMSGTLDHLADVPDGLPEDIRLDLREVQYQFHVTALWLEVLQEELLKQQGRVEAELD